MMGYNEKLKKQDYMAWLSNQYTMSAISVAVEHCLVGRKAKSKYIEKPLLSNKNVQSNKELTQEEKELKIAEFVSKMEQMEKNFKKNHLREEVE